MAQFQVTNEEFLRAIFGENAPFAHICSFPDDPSNISNDRRFKCWGGGYAKDIPVNTTDNTYYTVSIFNPDSGGKARRRKALFMATYIVTLDDVREKLPIEQVNKLPAPSYILETSPGSEQYGYILDQPCVDRHLIDNLHDGLIANGLAPNSTDPGQKGVTRYCRMPQGTNTKAKRVEANGGSAPTCKMLEWHPERKVSIQSLAEPFGVDLEVQRREGRVDGAADLPDHPLLDLADIIYVKDIRSDGRFDITCPWVDEHTDEADDGSAIFTNNDGSIGFKCHHGACQGRTGRDLLDRVEQDYPGFRKKLTAYKVLMEFGASTTVPTPPIAGSEFDGLSFLTGEPLGKVSAEHEAPQSTASSVNGEPDVLAIMLTKLKLEPVTGTEARRIANLILKHVDSLPHMEKIVWHNEVRDHMAWTKPDLTAIIREGRNTWYDEDTDPGVAVYDSHNYIHELGQFFDPVKRLFYKPENFQNSFCHIDEDIRVEALVNARCNKVDKIDYAPGFPRHFTEHGTSYVNTWTDNIEYGIKGDAAPWLDQFDVMGWGGNREHVVSWFAHTLQHPESKINHALIFGGGEGIGKDFIMYPVRMALGQNSRVVTSKELKSEYNDFLLNTKLILLNELDVGTYASANATSNALKGIITTPPEKTTINKKHVPLFEIRNIVNIMIGSNEALPAKLSNDTRRYYVMWSDLNIRDENGVIPAWSNYFKDLWAWLYADGWKYAINYLMNYDLSNFDPKQAPPVTDALRDIQEASMDPVMALFYECLKDKSTLFQSDLMTIKDIHQVMRTVDLATMGLNLKTLPSINILGKIIKQSNVAKITRVTLNHNDAKIYCIRNHNRYASMCGLTLSEEYHRQINLAQSSTKLALVNS